MLYVFVGGQFLIKPERLYQQMKQSRKRRSCIFRILLAGIQQLTCFSFLIKISGYLYIQCQRSKWAHTSYTSGPAVFVTGFDLQEEKNEQEKKKAVRPRLLDSLSLTSASRAIFAIYKLFFS